MAKKLRQGFYWRGSVVWVRTDPVTGKATSTGFHDPDAAYLWRDERERLAADPAYEASRKATIGEWVVKTLDFKAAQRSAGTLNMYEIKLGHFVRLWGKDATLANISPDAIDSYIATRSREGVVNNTIGRELTCLWQMLKLARRANCFAGDLDALKPMGFSPGYKPVTRILLASNLPALWAALQTDEQRAWVAFALTFAADSSDIERARPEDWDATNRLMFVHGSKTETRAAWLPVLRHVEALFSYALPRLPVSWPRASKALGDACRRAGIPHLSPKDLRRTAASWMVASGADISLVSRFLRHTSDAMVRKVYGRVTPEQLGVLLGSQTGAETLQIPPDHQGPLGEIGIREGLKSRRGGGEREGDHAVSAEISVANGREEAAKDAVGRTNSLHPTAAAWALALAAEKVLLGFKVARRISLKHARDSRDPHAFKVPVVAIRRTPKKARRA